MNYLKAREKISGFWPGKNTSFMIKLSVLFVMILVVIRLLARGPAGLIDGQHLGEDKLSD